MSFLNTLFGSRTQDDANIVVLSPSEFKARIQDKNIQLVDVRTPAEFNSGHIKRAKNIDFYSAKFASEFEKLDKDRPLYLYCRSGSRSRSAAKKLAALGFTELYDLQGGILRYNLS
ncbi:MAG: rhodanese-like domain-containing protein [Flavobacteriaceae bacterium]|nr:rhodanese-like domain-containing protein [Bacteroidia bacterium]NNL60442.1 rhodanese-like domain-containing protein [Flavobacteriaceae bacterium]RZV60429.1 MAG: rhodanese-like domain-containing protein [Flavobacteriaceae bacterium]